MTEDAADIVLADAMSARLVASTLWNKFGIPVDYSEFAEDAMVGFLEVDIFFSAQWRGSELRIAVDSEAGEKKLEQAFASKNLYTKKIRDRSLCVFLCDLGSFTDWSKAATSWNAGT